MVCKEIGLADEIERIVGVDPRQKVTCGEAVVAMVLNALGFVDRPLYLFPEFMATKPVEILIREGLKAEWIMRVLETLSEAKEVLENADTEKMKSTSLNGYRLFSIEVEYGGENAGEEDKEGERTGGERGMASLQSGVLQRGRRTEGCTGERKAVQWRRRGREKTGGRGRSPKTLKWFTVRA